jgi:hypothetical protein
VLARPIYVRNNQGIDSMKRLTLSLERLQIEQRLEAQKYYPLRR